MTSIHSKSKMPYNFMKDEMPANEKTNEFIKRTEDIIIKVLKNDLVGKEGRGDDFTKTALDKCIKKYKAEDNNKYSRTDTPEDNISEINTAMMPFPQPAGVMTDSDGLIIPKKLVNPCLESIDRRDLNRELRFNQKIGKNVLNQKSELQKALEKQKERQITQNQHDNNEGGLRNELNRAVIERAQKNEKNVPSKQDQFDSHVNLEYLNARAKLRTRIDTN